jgi:ribosomal protection tetracycline resistance protein
LVRTLNLGILAHVDAGKTSLTERLLFTAGVIDKIGSVDDGSTQTDTLPLERQRGITIKSAVVSFVIGDVAVNLIDTPGHPDFIAEVERVLSVLDGAILVISAVEGVQAQTRLLMRALQRLGIPTLIFVNKIDCGGAQYERVLAGITAKLTPATVAMGSVGGLGVRSAAFTPHGARDVAFAASLTDLLTRHDEALLAACVAGAAVPCHRLRGALAAQARQGLAHPVFFGSARTGAGVDTLTAGITELLPTAGGDAGGPVSGAVFKVERGRAGERIAYARMFSGTLRARDRLQFGRDGAAKVTAISVFDHGSAVRRASVTAGQIGRLWGLAEVQIGDTLGMSHRASEHRYFAPPTWETVVVPRRPADKGALHVALAQLTEQDPLIKARQDDSRQEISVSLYGEVQKEVIQATLAADFGIDVTFRETTTICIERPAGLGAAAEALHEPANPFIAGVGLRIEPAPAGAGVGFRLAIEPGSLPVPFRKAVEDSARETLRQGIHGWEVTDCTVTLTHSGYVPPQGKRGQAFDPGISSTAGDFRNLTPLVLMSALQRAGTAVHEPMHHFRLEIPADAVGPVLPALARLRAVPRRSAIRGSLCLLEGEIPAARVHALRRQLPALTRGEGVLDSAFERYQPVRGAIPARPRTDHNPLNRKEYLLHAARGVTRRVREP